MTSRYLTKTEFIHLFDKGNLPDDIKDGQAIGVSEPTAFSLLIESKKIQGVNDQTLFENYSNVHSTIAKGDIWILELSSDNLARLLLNSGFVEDFCDKKDNPYDLSRRVSLFYDGDYSYWTENVYFEAFDND